MSETTKAVAPNKNRRNLRNKLRKGGALAMSLGALSGMGAPAANAEISHAKSAKIEKGGGFPLRQPSELPGIKIHLGTERLNQIKQSTLEIGYRIKPEFGGSPNWQFAPNCTAVKVQVPGEKDPVIATAGHCLGAVSGAVNGMLTDPSNPGTIAENFEDATNLEFAVLDPNEPELGVRLNQPIAVIDKISVDTNDKDVAFLHPIATDPSQFVSDNIRSFDSIPAIPLTSTKAPKQGTPVALYGEPQANGFEPIAGTGIFLGRVYQTESDNGVLVTNQVDLVGIRPNTPQQDNCNFGTSGSMAILPNGQLLGNLSRRNNTGYGPDKTMQYWDNINVAEYWFITWEQQLNVDLSAFSTICTYSVLDNQTIQGLVKGFDIPTTLPSPSSGYVQGKGGGTG